MLNIKNSNRSFRIDDFQTYAFSKVETKLENFRNSLLKKLKLNFLNKKNLVWKFFLLELSWYLKFKTKKIFGFHL